MIDIICYVSVADSSINVFVDSFAKAMFIAVKWSVNGPNGH